MSLVLLAATSRFAVVEIDDGEGPNRLARPLSFAVADGRSGRTARRVFSLDGLAPASDQVLTLEDGRTLEFRTADETAFVALAPPGHVDATRLVQTTIDDAPAGATILLQAGTWRVGPLLLKGGVTLHLADGAVLSANRDRTGWPILPAVSPDGRVVGTWEGEPAAAYAAPLTAVGETGIAIVGRGAIDGGGDRGDWWSWPKETRDGARRARTIYLKDCTDVLVAGVSVRNSPSWTIHPEGCSRTRFLDLTISNPPDSPNTDGLNPESCEDVLIAGVRFSVGDDCIAIKSGKPTAIRPEPKPTRRVTVRRCEIERGHGAVVIGSETAGGVEDVTITDCTFARTDRGLRIKTRRGRGERAVIRRITMERVAMDRVATPIAVNAFYHCDADGHDSYVQRRDPLPVDHRTPTIADVIVRDVTATGAVTAAACVLGLPERPVTGLVMERVHVSFADDAIPEQALMADGLAPIARRGFLLENTTDPVVRDCTAEGRLGLLTEYRIPAKEREPS